MITIKIEESDLLDLLANRLDHWDIEEVVKDLYCKMYENYIENGVFDGVEINVNAIVDNDYVNYCGVVEKGEENYDELLKLYHDGNYDVSCETDYSFIEAVDEENGIILVRF